MSRATRTTDDLLTVKDFYALVPDGQKADLIDGVIYMASPDSSHASNLISFVQFLLRGFVAARKVGGIVSGSRWAFRLAKRSAPEPDVAYVAPERRHLIRYGGVRGAPDIAVEVVSRDSIDRDYRLKWRKYQSAGVREYWIIDPVQDKLTFLLLNNGRYRRVPLEGKNIFRSEVLPGFWLDRRWLLADSLPNDYDCLLTILKG
jgi:Uma2 family endonuclease